VGIENVEDLLEDLDQALAGGEPVSVEVAHAASPRSMG
jgi:hypothetical protein